MLALARTVAVIDVVNVIASRASIEFRYSSFGSCFDCSLVELAQKRGRWQKYVCSFVVVDNVSGGFPDLARRRGSGKERFTPQRGERVMGNCPQLGLLRKMPFLSIRTLYGFHLLYISFFIDRSSAIENFRSEVRYSARYDRSYERILHPRLDIYSTYLSTWNPLVILPLWRWNEILTFQRSWQISEFAINSGGCDALWAYDGAESVFSKLFQWKAHIISPFLLWMVLILAVMEAEGGKEIWLTEPLIVHIFLPIITHWSVFLENLCRSVNANGMKCFRHRIW